MNELDFIQTVKIQGQGYLLNSTTSVPKADGNRDYELIKQWLEKGNTPIPEFTYEELQQIELNKKLQDANQYLKDTDWVEPYLIKHYTGLELLNESSYKFEIERLRKEAIDFIRSNT